jgi:RNA polymerase sigma-70 factor, ECF subfamily
VNELEQRFEELTGENFNNFYNEHKLKLKWFLTKYTDKTDTIEDLIDETYIKVFIYLHTYKKPEDGGTKVSTWVYRIAENLAKFNHNRSNSKRTVKTISLDNSVYDNHTLNDVIADVTVDYLEIQEQEILVKEKATYIIKCIYDSEEKFKKVLVMREIEKMSYKNIAEQLKLNINTVKSQVKIGRRRIKKQVERKYKKKA